MTDNEINIKDIKDNTLKLLKNNNLDELTTKKIRRMLESKLNYPELSLDESEPKQLIKEIVAEYIASQNDEPNSPVNDKNEDNYKDDNENDNNENDISEEKPEINSEDQNENDLEDANESDGQQSEDEKSSIQSANSSTRKKTPTKAKASRNTKKRKLTKDDLDNQSDNETKETNEITSDKDEDAKTNTSSPTTKSKRGKTAKEPLDPVKEKIARLKSFIFKCGVRKMWSKELGDLNEKQQIKKLQKMLEELGVEGRPTLDKCRKVAEERELEAEKNSMDVSNIIDSDAEENHVPRTRSSTHATSSTSQKIKQTVTELESVKPQERSSFFSFLADSDIEE